MGLMYELNSNCFTNEQKKSIEDCLEKNITWLVDNIDNWVKDELIPEVSKMIKEGNRVTNDFDFSESFRIHLRKN